MEKFRIPAFYRTLSSWVNLFLEAGFMLERMEEPVPDDEMLAKHPEFYDTRIVAYYLHMRWRRPR